MEYEIKGKRSDTGKWWGFGRISQGTYGPRIGMKKTKELMDYINAVQDGGYINFSLFEKRDMAPKDVQLDDSIPDFGTPF